MDSLPPTTGAEAPIPCPSDDIMAQMVGGTLPAVVREGVLRHAVRCSSCLALLADLASPASASSADHHPGSSRSAALSSERDLSTPDDADSARPQLRMGSRRFSLLRVLGAGGMGIVYEALDRERGTRVALKTLRGLRADDILRLKTEFRALVDLRHPNLIVYGDLFEEEGRWCFTMELVEGTDLLAFVRPAARLDEGRLRAALTQLARGLSALHRAGKVHRDIKPSNVLVTSAGRVVILDLGLVRDLQPALPRSESGVVGTVAYMAPEQAAGQPVGPAADWYAVGTVLYQALTGTLPFCGPLLQVLADKQRGAAPSPRELWPGAPPDLVALCEDLLAQQPERRPSGEELLFRLRSPGEAALPPALTAPQSGSAFVGREPELAQLAASFAQVQQGRPAALLLAGEPGIGKSALMHYFLAQVTARHPDALVLTGRCYERESVPYKGFDALIDALSAYLHRLPEVEAAALLPRRAALLPRVFPVLERVELLRQAPALGEEVRDPLVLRLRLFSALQELLARIAERRPLVLAIDDLQWADPDSLALLRAIQSGPEAPAMLLLGTRRPMDEDLGLATLFRSLDLGPLPPAAGQALALALLGADASPQSAASLALESGGHPLFLAELIRHGQSAATDGALHLEDVLAARIARLEAGPRRLLALVVTAGGPLSAALVQAADGGPPAALDADLEALRGANLLRTTLSRGRSAVEPYHDRVRETALALLGAEERRRCHGRLAMALEAVGADPETLSMHLREAGQTQRAAHFAGLAADRAAAALAFDRAVELYRLALALGAPPGAERAGDATPGYRLKLAEALANAGRGPEAAATYLALAEAAIPPVALELRQQAGGLLLRSGHVQVGLAVLTQVLAGVGVRLPATPLCAALSFLCHSALLWLRGLGRARLDRARADEHLLRAAQVGAARGASAPRAIATSELVRIDAVYSTASGLAFLELPRAAALVAMNARLALRAGEPSRITRALVTYATFCALPGGWSRRRAARLLDRVEHLTQGFDLVYQQHAFGMARGIHAFLAGEFRRGVRLFEEVERVLWHHNPGELLWERNALLIYKGFCLDALGDIKAQAQRVPPLLREAELRGDRLLSGFMNYSVAVTLLAQDRLEEARRTFTEGSRLWVAADLSDKGVLIERLRVLLPLYEGQAQEAYQHMQAYWALLRQTHSDRVQFLRADCLRLRATCAITLASAASSSERERLLREAERDARRLAHEDLPVHRTVALCLRAGIGSVRRDPVAVTHFAAAAAAFDAAEMGLDAACARRRQGELLGGDAGRALREAADAWMISHGVGRPERMTALRCPGAAPQRPALPGQR